MWFFLFYNSFEIFSSGSAISSVNFPETSVIYHDTIRPGQRLHFSITASSLWYSYILRLPFFLINAYFPLFNMKTILHIVNGIKMRQVVLFFSFGKFINMIGCRQWINTFFVVHPNIHEKWIPQNYFVELEGSTSFQIIVFIKFGAMSYYPLESILLKTINNKISASSN